MKPSVVVGLVCLGGVLFALWLNRHDARVAADARRELQLEIQAESITFLEHLAKRVDGALLKWRTDNDAISTRRRETRKRTSETARRDQTLKEQLAVPLHPSLRRGGGLLGVGQGGSGSGPAPEPDAAHSGP